MFRSDRHWRILIVLFRVDIPTPDHGGWIYRLDLDCMFFLDSWCINMCLWNGQRVKANNEQGLIQSCVHGSTWQKVFYCNALLIFNGTPLHLLKARKQTCVLPHTDVDYAIWYMEFRSVCGQLNTIVIKLKFYCYSAMKQ